MENGTTCLALVHPRLPGVVVLNSWTTQPKCHTCEGKKCIHINIYIEGANNESNVDVNIEDKLPILENMKPKSVNKLDPTNKRGKKSNVFSVGIYFLPSKSEKKEIDKVRCQIKQMYIKVNL